MKISHRILTGILYLSFVQAFAQETVPSSIPMAKKKENQTFEEKLKDNLPLMNVGVTTNNSVRLPGNNGYKVNGSKDAEKFATETLPDLGLKVAKKAKKIKKNLTNNVKEFNGKDYEGIAVEKQLIRQGSGSRTTFFEFYTLKNFQQPSTYQRHIFWYDPRADRIVEALNRDTETNKIMHGPYKKYLNEDLIEEGYYYLGAKDSRWVKYDKDFNLLSKEKYEKGFLEESTVTYYDEQKTKIKEVLPKAYGKVTGEYLFFNETGTLAQQGMMDDSVKTGIWIDYYPLGNKRKLETQYAKDCFDKNFKPYVVRQYDEKGKMTFDEKKAQN